MEDRGETKYRTVVTAEGDSISAAYYGDEIEQLSDDEFVAMFREFAARVDREQGEGSAPE